ncbi:MAG: LptF/LptG family permease [Candidatus Omnitrophota bacterium]
MRIVDKYIIKRVLSGYLFILFVFIGLYLIIDVFSSLSDMLETKPPIGVLGGYYLSMLPLIFLRVSPLSLLISTLYTIGELNRNNEIISMRAVGMSISRVAFPIIFTALAISFISFYIQEQILMRSQKKVEDIKMRYIKKDFSGAQIEKNFAFLSGDMIVVVREYSLKDKAMDNVIIFKRGTEGNFEKKIICKSIVYRNDQWVALNAIEYFLDDKGSIIGPKTIHHKEKTVPLTENPRELIYKKSIYAQFTSLKNLRQEIKRLKKVKAFNVMRNLKIDFYQKIAEPFTHLFLIIGVLPFALEIKKRKVALSALGVGLMFGFTYYLAINPFSIALGKSGVLLPALSAWAAPLFFLTVGISGMFLVK